MKKPKEQIILGDDPGVASVGFGLIKKEGSNVYVINYGVIKTPAKDNFEKRLFQIHKELQKIIKKYKPDVVAVEDLFFFKNAKTAIKVGQARGVVLLTANIENIPVDEYTPLQIKQAVTSYGRADKNQIQQMVKNILQLKEIPKPDDAADALATAICCAQTNHITRNI